MKNDLGRYSKITRRMWNDAMFRDLSSAPPNGQTLWIRLLTGTELTNIPGLFPAWDAGLARALRWSLEGFHGAFGELSSKGMAEADWHSGLVWVPKAITHNEPDNANVVLSWRAAWQELPECELKHRAHRELRHYLKGMGDQWVAAFDKACPEPSAEGTEDGSTYGSPNSLANQEQEQEQEQEQDPKHVEQELDAPAREPSADPVPANVPGATEPEAPVAAPTTPPEPAKQTVAEKLRGQARFVFETWKLETGKFRAVFDDKRERRIVSRLREGFTPDQLVLAIQHRRNDPHLMGETTGVEYAEIDTLLRDRAQVERLIELKERRAPSRPRVRDPGPRQDHNQDVFAENERLKLIGGNGNG